MTALVLAAFSRDRSIKDIDAELARKSSSEQSLAFGAVATVIIALSFFAAQFGWIGLLVFWLALIFFLR